MKVGINRQVIGKLHPQPGPRRSRDTQRWTSGWQREDLTVEAFAAEIRQGYGFGPWFRDAGESGYRSKNHLICTQVLAVDIDNKAGQRCWSLPELLAFPLVQESAAFIYTTPSHRPDAPRYRVVFELETEIDSPDRIKSAYKALVEAFDSDEATTAPAQCFHGSPGCEVTFIRKALTQGRLNALIAEAEGSIAVSGSASAKSKQQSGRKAGNTTRGLRLPRSALVRCGHTGRDLPLMSLGNGHKVHCPDPDHPDESASAAVLTGEDGTVRGVYCHAHRKMYFVERPGLQDPSIRFWKEEVVAKALRPDSDMLYIPSSFDWRKPDEVKLGSIPTHDGLILLKAPKGAGKTEMIGRLIESKPHIFEQKNGGVLVIGHRVALLKNMSKRLKLTMYERAGKVIMPNNRYAVTVDSLANRLRLTRPVRKYHTVVLDEVEQVVDHLQSETLQERRHEVVEYLLFTIKHAKRLILSDADIGANTRALLKAAGRLDDLDTAIVVEHEPKAWQPSAKFGAPEIFIFEGENDLQDVMLEDYSNQGQLFVCSNSKEKADEIADLLRSVSTEGRKPVLLVTQKTKGFPEVARFLDDPREEFWRYSAVVSSPTIGSGVDLSLSKPSGVHVSTYGFFVHGVNTHWDADQHLSRVRNPDFVAAWLTPVRAWDETDPESIKEEVREMDISFRRLTALDDDGNELPADDPTLELYAAATSLRRFSMNRFRKNFINYKRGCGWIVSEIKAPDNEFKELRATKSALNKSRKERAEERLISAAQINAEQAKELLRQRRDEGKVSEAEQASLERFFIEAFYRAEISSDLIKRDRKGKFRSAIETYESLALSEQDLMEQDRQQEALFVMDRQSVLHARRVMVRLIRALGLSKLYDRVYDDEWEVCQDSSSLARFRTEMDDLSKADFTAIGLKKRSDLHESTMKSVTDILGVIGMKTRKTRREGSDADRVIWYGLCEQSFNSTMDVVLRRLKDRREREGYSGEVI